MNLIAMLVEWVDARHYSEDTVYCEKDIQDTALAKVRTIGFGTMLKDKVFLATEDYCKVDGEQGEGARNLYVIPMVCVDKIIELEEGKVIFQKENK